MALKKWILFLLSSLIFGQLYGEGWVKILNLSGSWRFSIGDNMHWAAPSFDDKDWESIHVPATWEDEGFHGYNGYAWYRKSFEGASLPKNKDVYIFLGYIDDVDEVYINGNLVGLSGAFPPQFSTAYKAFRRYLIPKKFLKPNGENIIAVRVYDTINEGGIVSGQVGLFSRGNDFLFEIDLEGLWHFSTGDNPNWKKRYWNAENWEKIMVPAPWENQGFRKYDGYAWYRKRFVLPENLENADLVLVLGLIDDFDEVYVNGKFIGGTNDNKNFGLSSSFMELRAYSVPIGLLKKNQQNTIAVRVSDIGNIGGIYEGPVGIIRKSRMAQFIGN